MRWGTGMVCAVCGGRTQAETVIVVRRTLGALRATRRAAWYCWTCKASTPERTAPALPAQPARTRLPRFAPRHMTAGA